MEAKSFIGQLEIKNARIKAFMSQITVQSPSSIKSFIGNFQVAGPGAKSFIGQLEVEP